MMPSLPSLSKAYSVLQHDEKQKETSAPIPSFSNDSVSFTAATGPISNHKGYNQRVQFESKKLPGPSRNVVCKYCKKPGHTIDKCYRLHGFPPDFKFTKSRRSAACVQSESSGTSSSFLNPSPSEVAAHGFTKKQYQHFMTLFQNVNIATPTSHLDNIAADSTGFANFAGPFSEEASGNW
uniref:Uncharacterized protein n=1 Tax=Nicotiana tabacum TaxID=4097 RepID=A0A1S4CDW1_TOBAC|nr:PREDICTED: uncharacterized protein LOC107818012 [Nicotiana tabacum]